MRRGTACLPWIALGLTSFLAAPCAGAEVGFHWSPAPTVDPDGQPLAEAVLYEVYQESDGGLARLVTTVRDTTCILDLDVGITHRIRVCGVDERHRRSLPSEWSEPIELSAPLVGQTVPAAAQLAPNYPNPFNPETTIVYGVPGGLPAGAAVALEVFDARGALVKTLAVDRTPGWHEVLWDGSDRSGRVRPAGQYVVRLRCGGRAQAWKMTMVK